MRKYLFIILLLTMQTLGHGQTLAVLDSLGLPHPTSARSIRYWINDDANSVVVSNILTGKHTIDVSSLLEGLHTIHYQIIDNEDHAAIPYSAIFLKMSGAIVPSKPNVLRYWFDDDTKVMTCKADIGMQTLDVSHLIDGLHTIHYQIVDDKGNCSYIASSIFLKMYGGDIDDNVSGEKLIYWFDDESATTSVDIAEGIQVVDASRLIDGLHIIHYMIKCSDGSVSPSYSKIFLSMTNEITTTKAECLRYWFDDELETTVTGINTGVQTLDASRLLDGLHTIHYQLIDDKGMVATPMSEIFLKLSTKNIPATAQSLRYWFDEEKDVRTTEIAEGIHTLEVSMLNAGLHIIHYQIVDGKGEVSVPISKLFIRMFDDVITQGKNTITQYTYWINDNTKEGNTIKISNPASSYHLVDQLPTISEPIRSTSFHFEIKDSQPYIYAKNDLKIRFEDAAGYWTDAARSYIDYNVSQAVNNITELLPTQTFGPIDNNSIKWFCFEAGKGDILKIKTDQACTIQLFSPDSKEIYNVVGDKATTWDKCYALTDGTHYLAVHDVTGSKQNITLSFKHIVYSDIYINSNTTIANENIENDSTFSKKPSLMLCHDFDNLAIRGHLSVSDDASLSLSRFVQTGNLGNYTNQYKYTRVGADYYHPTTLVNNGFMRADEVMVKEGIYRDKWHFISLPFNVNIKDIRKPNGTYYAIREYDGEERSVGNNNNVWKNVNANSMMEATKGYILQLTSEHDVKVVELSFPSINDAKKNNIFCNNDVTTSLNEYIAEFPHNRGWNLIGNPYPCFYDTRYMDMTGTITVWNGNGYSAYSLQDDHYILMPFEAFFVQKPLNRDNIVFSKDGRQHTEVANNNLASKVNLQRSNPNRIIYNIQLSNEEYTDKSRIVLNEDATLDYETDKDAVKFMEQKPTMPQLYSTETGVNYAINERPVNDGIVNLSVYLPEDGTYSIHMDETDNDVWLIDTEKNVKTPLNREAYSFDGSRGSHNGRFIIAFNDTPTSIENIADAGQGDVRVVDHTLSFNFINQCNVKLFGANGTLFYNKKAKCDHVKLDSGIYILDINGKSTKVAIK